MYQSIFFHVLDYPGPIFLFRQIHFHYRWFCQVSEGLRGSVNYVHKGFIYTVKLARAKLPPNAGNFTCNSQVKKSLAQFTCVTCSLPVTTGKFTCFEAASTSRRTHAHCLRVHVNLPEYHKDFSPNRYEVNDGSHFRTKNPKINPFKAKSFLESNCKRFHQSAI